MPLDSYSLCPGGTGKRIKFCCKDLVPQLQQLERMIEGEQNTAALQQVERQLQETPDRACLLSLRAMLLRMVDKLDEHGAAAALFVEKHPTNPMALAEQAMALAAEPGRAREAMESLERAIAASGEGLSGRVYEAMDAVAHALLEQGQVVAARALLLLQTAVHQEDQHPLEMVLQLNASPAIPLLLKDDTILDVAPEGAAWKPAFDAATQTIAAGQWLSAAEQLAALAEREPGEPAIWRNLATLRMWLADSTAAVEALHRLAALPVPLEDAAEAEATALFMSADPLGDEVDQLLASYTITDPEATQTALAGWTRAMTMPVDPASLAREGEPPPKSLWFLLDRAPLTAEGEVDPMDVPQILCQVAFYGRQTDRDARLELLGIAAPQRERLEADLRDLLGAAIAPGGESKVLGRISASRLILRLARYLPRGISRDETEQLVERLLDHAALAQWPDHALGLLGGRTPREAAKDPQTHVKLLAAILLLEHWMEAAGENFDFNRLRASLGLPALEPIDPTRTRADRLPLDRLARVEVEKLADDALLSAYHRVVAFRVLPAIKKYSQAVVDRPQVGRPEEREMAYRLLAQREKDLDKAVGYLDQGRKEAVAGARSCATFDLMELPLRLQQGAGSDLGHLVNHLQREHLREPGVAEALAQFLVEIGAIRPDGTAAPMRAPAAEQPGIVVPGAEADAAGKIWTPDSQTPGGAKSGKIWTPE